MCIYIYIYTSLLSGLHYIIVYYIIFCYHRSRAAAPRLRQSAHGAWMIQAFVQNECPSEKVGFITSSSPCKNDYQINYNCFNEAFAVSPYKHLYWDMHGLNFETSIWLLAGSTRFVHHHWAKPHVIFLGKWFESRSVCFWSGRRWDRGGCGGARQVETRVPE